MSKLRKKKNGESDPNEIGLIQTRGLLKKVDKFLGMLSLRSNSVQLRTASIGLAGSWPATELDLVAAARSGDHRVGAAARPQRRR